MGEGEMIVALAGIVSGTTMFVVFAVFIKDLLMRRMTGQGANQAELKELREELARLRQTNDAVLSFDATLQRLDDRLARLEQRAALPGNASHEESEAQRISARLG
jgi:hypothetical protein